MNEFPFLVFRTFMGGFCGFPVTFRLVKKGPNLLGKTSVLTLLLLLNRGVAKLDDPLEGGADGVTATCP